LLADGRWHSGNGLVEWQLLQGDFAQLKFDAPRPDIIYFDPFSSKTNAELWTLPAFNELHSLCDGKATELFTYTYSTAVRAAMLAAGFYVAKGCETGPKNETTIGLTRAALKLPHARQLLGSQWLERWHRSTAKAPLGTLPNDETWQDAVLAHPQFAIDQGSLAEGT
jgi:queuine tRNA-ribosyltransferase